MSITDFIIWNNLINNSALSEPIEWSPAFEAFLSYTMIGLIGTALVMLVCVIGAFLWIMGDIAWDWLKEKYDARK